jgi:hypothetical protein
VAATERFWRNPMKIALATAVRVVTSNGSKVKAIGGGI